MEREICEFEKNEGRKEIIRDLKKSKTDFSSTISRLFGDISPQPLLFLLLLSL
jgi:hypothetical protein